MKRRPPCHSRSAASYSELIRTNRGIFSLGRYRVRVTRRVAIGSGLDVCLLAQKSGPPSTTLKVGDKVPDFTLPSTNGGSVHLADYLGKSTVVLAFFPAAFTGG